MARMSSWVMVLSGVIGRPSSRSRPSVTRPSAQATGRSSTVRNSIGRISASATRSGSFIESRLGSRSASTTNSVVTQPKDSAKATRCAVSTSISGRSSDSKWGVSAPSPTTPARMASVLTPICTTVK